MLISTTQNYVCTFVSISSPHFGIFSLNNEVGCLNINAQHIFPVLHLLGSRPVPVSVDYIHTYSNIHCCLSFAPRL